MKTAIIGLGNIGCRIATNLIAGGERAIIAERNLEKAKQLGATSYRKRPYFSVLGGYAAQAALPA
jgi:predicted dinucleotide-binding enzyme